jgi:uncharacterized protein (DUF983 family)
MRRTLYVLLLGFMLRCPVCHRGKMFASLFKMHPRCPHCGVVFERHAGEVTGGMAITLVLVSTITVVSGSLLAVLTTISPLLIIGALSLFTVVVGLLFYRHARGLWVSFLYLSDSMFED